jgi:hypothetical protein
LGAGSWENAGIVPPPETKASVLKPIEMIAVIAAALDPALVLHPRRPLASPWFDCVTLSFIDAKCPF